MLTGNLSQLVNHNLTGVLYVLILDCLLNIFLFLSHLILLDFSLSFGVSFVEYTQRLSN